MNLATRLLQQIDDPTLSHAERARLRCQLAKELEGIGNYEAARGALGDLWQRIGEQPQVANLDRQTAAEVLLRAGTLSGWLGSSNQIEGAQEFAKNLISESISIFESLNEIEKAAEGQSELAYCYWREGAFDEARVTLSTALSHLTDNDGDIKAVAVLRYAIVELSATRYHDALRILTEAAPLFEASNRHLIKGNFHVNLAIVLKNLSTSEQRNDYADRALIEFAAASYHFEQAGHIRYQARTENNLGFLLFMTSRFTEAYEHLNRARRLFVILKDSGSVAQVDETRARALLAEGRNADAERVVRSAVRTLEKGDEHALLAEALTTHGRSLARLGHHNESRLTLQRAIEVAENVGNIEGAGLASLTIIEELGERLTHDEIRTIYQRADYLLSNSQHPETLVRLRLCARRMVEAESALSEEFSTPNFIYAAEQTAALLRDAHRIAGTHSAVLITGETGTGKEVLARLIHQWSERVGEMVAINCAAIPDTLIESQLFGHRRGSFTDAVADYPGAVREAASGTLFLDEIGELSLAYQAKLLRLIENGEIHTIGAATPERVDVRIIAATNRDLKELVKRGRFREDLFYRLNTFHLEIPPLRERPEDIPVIAEHFIKEFLDRHRKRVTFSPQVIAAMRMLPLRGNARELRSLIERTVLTATDGTTITEEAVETVALRQTQHAGFADPWANFSLKEEVRLLEDRFIELALKHTRGMVTRAAKLLGFKHHETLRYRLEHKNKNLQAARKPASPRKRSIIRR
jgi:two-component system response regulator PilR (NtrC family)